MTRHPSGSGLATLTACLYGPAVASLFGWPGVAVYALVAGPWLGRTWMGRRRLVADLDVDSEAA